MKILILGHGRHGKDTVAEIISKITGMTFTSSSLAALDVIWPVLSYIWEDVIHKEEAYAYRHENRELWKRLIALYNAADPGALCKKILQDNDIYVGMRRQEEYEATKHLFDLILWVDATPRIKEKDSTMAIEYDESRMKFIDNSTSLCNLHETVTRIIYYI